jgi:hypothetical protein
MGIEITNEPYTCDGAVAKLGRPRGTIALYTGERHEMHLLRDRILAIPAEGASVPGMVRGVLALLGGFAREVL